MYLVVDYDEISDVNNPVEDDDCIYIVYRDTSRYRLGDTPVDNPVQYFLELLYERNSDALIPLCENHCKLCDEELQELRDNNDVDWAHLELVQDMSINDIHEIFYYLEETGMKILPVYTYIHSGVSMNTSGFHCPWDSGQSGWIYSTDETIDEEALRSIVRTFGEWVDGQVYILLLYDDNDNLLCTSCSYIGNQGLEDMISDFPKELQNYVCEAQEEIGEKIYVPNELYKKVEHAIGY